MKNLSLISILLSLFVLTACATQGANKQAKNFWQAVEQENFDAAARLTINPSPTKLRLLTAPVRGMSAEMIDSKVEGDKAVVLTKLVGNGNSEYLMTIMVKHDGAWLIDDQAMLKSAVTYRLNRFASEVSVEASAVLEQAMQDLEDSWQDIQRELEKQAK